MINFEIFSRLYREAADYANAENYIGERGYQADLMDSSTDAGALLTDIWELAHMDLKHLRERSGLDKISFAARFDIPLRTIQNWETTSACHREPPKYVKALIAFTLLRDL